jgi:hypothetical protein
MPLISGPLRVLLKDAYIITLRNDYKKIMGNHLSKVKSISRIAANCRVHVLKIPIILDA